MPVELTIRVISPLEPEDKDLLTGTSIMLLAIANHEMAKAAFPETFQDDEEAGAGDANEEPHPCGASDPDDPRRSCVSAVAHRGRHRFRPHEGGPTLARSLPN